MIKLFLDIETLPCSEDRKDLIVGILSKKPDKLGVEKTAEQLFLTTSLNGTFGRIFCIGYILEDGTITRDVLRGDEKEILTQFWKLAKNIDLFVGHNIFGFDFPFIYKRSIILGVKPRFDISFAKYRSQPIFDTMTEWEKWGSFNGPSLDTLAKILGLPSSKDEMNGSEVWTYFQNGKLDDICRYCLKDVELTRSIYQRMVFEDPTATL